MVLGGAAMSLLMRFHDPSSGRITVDGVDLRAVTQASWRAQLGVVFQENLLFRTSLLENIRMGRSDASDGDVEAAARQAGIHDTLVRLMRRQAGAQPPVPSPPGESEALLRRSHGGQRVLLAEDNPVNREVTLSLLEGSGLTLDVAADGVEAVELAGQRRYDLVLMDMQMPRMDGLETLAKIRASGGPNAEIPVIACTANVLPDQVEAYRRAGTVGVLAKPIDPRAMLQAVMHA